METIRLGWAELLTGRAASADSLNTLFSMAQVACDKRCSTAVADRAAARYGSDVRHEAFISALPCAGEPQALAAHSKVLRISGLFFGGKTMWDQSTCGSTPFSINHCTLARNRNPLIHTTPILHHLLPTLTSTVPHVHHAEHCSLAASTITSDPRYPSITSKLPHYS